MIQDVSKRSLKYVVALMLVAGPAAAFGDAREDALKGIESNRRQLNAFSAKFTLKTEFYALESEQKNLPDSVRRSVLKLPLHRVESASNAFSYFSGQTKMESWPMGKANEEKDATADRNRSVLAFSPGRYEEMNPWGDRPAASGIIGASKPIPDEWTLDLALGLRLARQTWGDLPAASRYEMVSPDEPDIVKFELTTADGPQENGLKHTLCFDKRLDHALVRYRITYQSGSYEEIVPSDFRRTNGMYLPFRVVREAWSKMPEGKPMLRRRAELEILEYKCPDNDLNAQTILVKWPANAKILDTRSNEQFTLDNGATTLPDSALAKLIAERMTEKSKRLEQAKKVIEAAGK